MDQRPGSKEDQQSNQAGLQAFTVFEVMRLPSWGGGMGLETVLAGQESEAHNNTGTIPVKKLEQVLRNELCKAVSSTALWRAMVTEDRGLCACVLRLLSLLPLCLVFSRFAFRWNLL